ncbi:MAG: DUF3179 domain-containing protein [Anaerolineales bacterium]|nr:DUF3179 domain-containing protein [Anaerolineales bacterium]
MTILRSFSLTILFTILFTACAPVTPAPTAVPTETPRPRLLLPGELQIAADIDDIPAIFASDDLFVDVQAGNQEWPPEELVIGVEINGQARAYPIRLLSSHEIVNDVIGGEPVAVTWCPLCFSALVFNRIVDGRELTFGVSGYLYHNNLVMYDHQTNTFWSQLLGQAIRGAQRRTFLEARPSVLMSWSEWQADHPHTTILSASRMSLDADSIIDPYAGYYLSGSPGMMGPEFTDERLPPKSLVLGLLSGNQAHAYSLESIRSAGLLNEDLDGRQILLVYDETVRSVFVYETEVDGRHLTFEFDPSSGALRDLETASHWDPGTGEAVSGLYQGRRLSRLVSPLVYWYAWVDIHPETKLFQP